jgi:adenylate cyclase
MQLAMREVNAFNRREGLPEVTMGIAVNTGDVVVGNIGSQTRAKYGVVGTHVNLAGRIEGFTVGGQILVSDATLRRAGAALTVAERVTFEAKGFQEPVVVHDLRGVGGRHALSLPARDETMRPLRQPLAVEATLIEGKHMQAAAIPGTLVKAAAESAELRVAMSLKTFANLRLRLNAAGVQGEIYAKVTAVAGDGTFVVRFTSVDPVAARLIEQALAS